MAKGICADGTPVDQKVKEFQDKRNSDDFALVKKYYDDFRNHWYKQVEDFIDKEEFNREWYNKLLHSVETYREDKALQICRIHGWSMTNKFNRWFYSALKNWVCNIKSQAFRIKKHPGIVCPICLREVCKIEEKHLQHIRTIRDLPKFFEYEGEYYRTCTRPRKRVRKYLCDFKDLRKGITNRPSVPVKWLWFLPDGKPGVYCPYTKKVVPIMDDEYINSLPKKFKHYAQPYTWFEFQQQFPTYLVHSEIMSLDFSDKNTSNNRVFIETVGGDKRLLGAEFPSYTCDYHRLGRGGTSSPLEYEHVLKVIEGNVSDSTDKAILRYMMIGYGFKDVCDELGISKKELKHRITLLKKNNELESSLEKAI